MRRAEPPIEAIEILNPVIGIHLLDFTLFDDRLSQNAKAALSAWVTCFEHALWAGRLLTAPSIEAVFLPAA